MVAYSCGCAPFKVTLRVVRTEGRGICALVTGGTSPHVGGIAVAVPRGRSDGEGMTCDISQICVPGHKDVYAAAEAARIIALGTGEVVSVTAGIHVDDATEDQIALLMENVAGAVKRFLEEDSGRAVAI